jgi:hypothetical protein
VLGFAVPFTSLSILCKNSILLSQIGMFWLFFHPILICKVKQTQLVELLVEKFSSVF